jgi:hypothetical protein
MKTLENHNCWTGNFNDYQLIGIEKNNQKIDLTNEFVGLTTNENNGDATRREGKDLDLIDKSIYKSAFYLHKRPSPYDNETIIDKIILF